MGALGFRTAQDSYGECLWVNLDTIDAGGQRRASMSLLTPGGNWQPRCNASSNAAAVLRAPPAPTQLNAEVTGNTGSLSWQNPDTLEFEVEVGPPQEPRPSEFQWATISRELRTGSIRQLLGTGARPQRVAL
jgi:hypothetical protein